MAVDDHFTSHSVEQLEVQNKGGLMSKREFAGEEDVKKQTHAHTHNKMKNMHI